MQKYGGAREATNGDIIRHMRLLCWITKATHTYSEYVIVIAFSLQQLLHERALVLRYTYDAGLVI